ncbi:hypothetical protein [Hymenobacter latericus]|uniref:hypothetical protein n=1 Tax=Hymenobacter sp. YIM 151858-1 TaxID=2987688 RepID=UPI0022260652|nr:hypothetical protein [Hymenobacter sp. YIM 151858-1]UYZ60102.1 hypothetical protein OIS50_04700 [Hymenobacter sp. YIM 151858-1]
MSTTRAKFKVDYVQDFGTSATVKLSPVYGTSGENKTFWDATPCGSIELMIQNRTALAGFKPQAEFYIDFTPVESTNTQVLRNVATPPRIPGDHPRG